MNQQNMSINDSGEIKKDKIWILETDGTNLSDILLEPYSSDNQY
mgnify:CR=1 FL=1